MFGKTSMASHAKVAGHPLHPILIAFPLGLLTASLIFDFRAKKRLDSTDTKIARALVGAGVLSGLVAAIPGIIDWLNVPQGSRAKTIGLWHGSGNILALSLFAWSWKKRRPNETQPDTSAVVLSVLGSAILGLTGWLGGEMVYRLGIGVDPGANPDAPNSLIAGDDQI